MKVRVEALSQVERKLSIEVEPAVVAQELDRAYRELSRQVKLAGFRPGKVPRRILEQRFHEQVEDDVIRSLVQKAYLDAIRAEQVEAVGPPRVTNEPLKPDSPFTFEARVEVRPKVVAKDYRALPLTRMEVKVEEAQLAERLEQLRRSHSRLEPVEGREVAQPGDFAIIDFQATCEGRPFPGNKAEGLTAEVAPGELIESKIAALEGLKVGQARELDYRFPEDYPEESVRGKTAHFQLWLKALKKRTTPELNDDFAKEAGSGAQTVEELRGKVRADLERAIKAKAEQEEREQLVKALIEKNPLEVPVAMVERALDAMLRGALQMLGRGGVDPRHLGLDFERLRQEMRPRAESEVKAALLVEAISEQESIQASDQELEQRLEKIAEESGQPLFAVRRQFRGEEERQRLASRIREEKTIEFLKSLATYS